MKRFITKKPVVIGATIAVAISAAVAGYAYFTASGEGTGSATVGSATPIDLSSPLVGDLYPDGADVPVTVTIANGGSAAQYVNTVSGTVRDSGGCDGDWFEIDSITYQDTIAANGSDTAGTSIRMLDSGTNQDACQGASLTIDWSSN
jgi:hypothetical protein